MNSSQKRTLICGCITRTQLRGILDKTVTTISRIRTSNFVVPFIAISKALAETIVPTWTIRLDHPQTIQQFIPLVFVNVEPFNSGWPRKAAIELCSSPNVGLEFKLIGSIVVN